MQNYSLHVVWGVLVLVFRQAEPGMLVGDRWINQDCSDHELIEVKMLHHLKTSITMYIFLVAGPLEGSTRRLKVGAF